MRKGHEVPRFLLVIEFGEQCPAELVEDRVEIEVADAAPEALQGRRHVAQHCQVFQHPLAHAGPLDLHCHLTPIPQDGTVDLPERCGGDRLLIECDEGLRDLHAQLVFDHLHRVPIRKRFDVVLQPFECGQIARMDQVGPG
jgi:hypothetical protein